MMCFLCLKNVVKRVVVPRSFQNFEVGIIFFHHDEYECKGFEFHGWLEIDCVQRMYGVNVTPVVRICQSMSLLVWLSRLCGQTTQEYDRMLAS